MAEAVVSALLPVVFENIFNKLSSAIGNEFRLIQGVKEDLHNLEEAVKKFKHVLRDGEVKEFQSEDTRNWLRRLKYVANEADGILDDAIDSDNDNQSRVCFPFPPCIGFNLVKVRHNLGKRIRSVTQKFDLLDSEKNKLDFGEIDMKRQTISTLSEPKPFGRQGAKEEIIEALLNGAGGPPFIYAIVGSGGIGKTTLAQLIYNDEKVIENFYPTLWVWISQTFDVEKVMRNLIEAHSKTPCQLESLEAIQKKLKELLNGKKFFIALDDVWISDEDLHEWNQFKSVLACGAIGSSVILTTRDHDVASLAGSHDRHNIALLSEDQSWDLFKESSFLEEKQENGELEVIGKQIVQKCGRLPLAVKNLGGSLRSTRVVREWESVRDSEIWELKPPFDILPALKLSLKRLESHSRDCFAFSSIFPKGYVMKKEQLIHLWMANGLVPSRRRLDLEDMGNTILNELVLKSFFQISGNSSITMHDLMHDLGRSFRDECFCLEDPDVSIVPPRILHLSISDRNPLIPNILETLSKSHPSLHTCILLKKPYSIPFKQTIFRNLDCLRALGLENIEMDNLPLSIGKSKHLKYLNLSTTHLTHLPDTVCTLTKLQTLILRNCSRLTHLPDGIGQLINLRHLDLSGCKHLTHLPVGISQLTNLRHLKIDECYDKLTQLPSGMGKLVYLRVLRQFTVGQESGHRITELQGLNHLGGSLAIRGLEHVRDANEAREAVLKKKNMSSLSLIWEDLQGSNSTSDEAEGVLEALQPPQSLNRKLVIKGYGGSAFASWVKLLGNLVAVELRDCVKCERLPPLGQLPLLKHLSIIVMKSIKCIGTDFYGGDGCTGSNSNSGSERRRIFPSLERLVFFDMPMLEEWHATEVTDRQQTSPCPRLKELVLSNCPNLTLLPLPILSSVQNIEIYGCDKVIVRSLPCLTSLKLHGFGNNIVTSFPDGSFQNVDALKFLEIKFYFELTSLPDGISNLNSLKTLEISTCPALQSLPLMGSSLVEMHIDKCRSLKSLSHSLRDLSALKSLHVSNCDQLEFLYIKSCPALQSLPPMGSSLVEIDIYECHSLKSLSLSQQYLSTLESLRVSYCDQLEFSVDDFQKLVSLKTLEVDHLSRVASLPNLQHLSTLKSLTVSSCDELEFLKTLEVGSLPRVTSLPSLQYLSTLQCINLRGLNKLTSLPDLQHLRSLQSLEISYCPNLKTLPPWMENLTSLRRLWIQGCHRDLHLRCEKDKGEYWPFISHIQRIYIRPPKQS